MKRSLLNFSLILSAGCLLIVSSCAAQPSRKKPVTNTTHIVSIDNSTVFQLPEWFNGFNTQMMRGPSWKTPGFVDKVKQLHPHILRYPGGTVASYWDWKTGWLMDKIAIKKEWENIPRSPITLEDFKFACTQTGAQPLFVLNMMNSTIDYQLEMLKTARTMGMNVKFVELDNELYLGDQFYVSRFPTGVEYATEANTWIQKIKAEFPGVKVAVVGYSTREGGANQKPKKWPERTQNWNRDVLSVIKKADGMTFHVYGGSGLAFLSKSGNGGDDDSENESDQKQGKFQKAFDDGNSTEILLGIPFARWNTSNTYDYQLLPKEMKAWITEYNLFEREGVLAGTWTHGLYALMQTLLFLENRSTELICYHNLTTSAQFAAIFNNTEGFAKSTRKTETQQFGLTAAGMCLSLSGEAFEGGGKANKLNFGANAQLKSFRGQTYNALNGWVVVGKNGTKIIVVNLSGYSKKVSFSKVISGNVVYTQYCADPHAQIANESDVMKKDGIGTDVIMVPYSVTLIENK